MRRGNCAPAGAQGGCGPHFSFVLPKEKSPPQRWKRKTLGRINLTQRCQVDRKYEGRRDRCGADLQARTGCAQHRRNRDSPPPHLWAPTCFRGGQRKVCPLSPARSASLRATAPLSPGWGIQRGGAAAPPLCVVRGCGGEIETPPRFWRGFKGEVSLRQRHLPLSPHAPRRGRFFMP